MASGIGLGRAALAAVALLGAGCLDAPDIERRTSAVLGGTASAVDAVVMAVGNDSACGAVAVGTRHVLTVDFCASGTQILVGASSANPDLVADVIEVVTGPQVVSDPNAVNAVLLVTDQDLPLTPANLAAGAPAVNEVLTAVGYGTESGSTTVRTEGPVRVSSVDGDLFVAGGVGGAEMCPGDAGAFDGDGNYVGMALYGAQATGNCLDPMTCVAVSALRTFVETNVPPVTSVDAGPGSPDAAAASPDSGVGAADAGADDDDDDGGGCRLGDDRQSPATAWLLLTALGLATRARRRRQSRGAGSR